MAGTRLELEEPGIASRPLEFGSLLSEEGLDADFGLAAEDHLTLPRGVGLHEAVSALGEMVGSVSGGCVEGAVVQEALVVLASGQPSLVEYGIADELAMTVGLACGGNIQVFVEPLNW